MIYNILINAIWCFIGLIVVYASIILAKYIRLVGRTCRLNIDTLCTSGFFVEFHGHSADHLL
jgi:hypothetical protein